MAVLPTDLSSRNAENFMAETARKRPFQFSLRTLSLLFIPLALGMALATWLYETRRIDVAITVDRCLSYDDGNGRSALGAEVRTTNRLRSRVWYLEYPRYCLLQRVDGNWQTSWTGTKLSSLAEEPDWWTVLEGMESATFLVGPISEDATEIQVGVPFTTDRFAPKPHWLFTPVLRKVGNAYLPKSK